VGQSCKTIRSCQQPTQSIKTIHQSRLDFHWQHVTTDWEKLHTITSHPRTSRLSYGRSRRTAQRSYLHLSPLSYT
jgi:hypothetical protein